MCYQRRKRLTRARGYARRAVLVVAGITLGLLIGESVVRLLGLGPKVTVVYRTNYRLSENPVLEYELVPGSTDGDSVISSTGLRDREFPVDKPDGVFRIAVIGDSVAYGVHVRQDEPFAKQLEQMLNYYAPASAPRYEVLNFGVTGYNTTQVVERLRADGLAYDPDLVIYAYVLNDPQSFSLELESLKTMHEDAQGRLDRALFEGVSRWLSYSRLYQLARVARLRPPKKPDLFPQEPAYAALREGDYVDYFKKLHENGKSWQGVQEGLAELARVTARPCSIPVLVAIFPVRIHGQTGPYPFDALHVQVSAEAGLNGFEVLDLLPAYLAVESDSGERLYDDPLHPSLEGHHLAALALLKWLCESGLLPGEGIAFDKVLHGREADAATAAVLVRSPG